MGVAGLEPEIVTWSNDKHLQIPEHHSATESGAVDTKTGAIGNQAAILHVIITARPTVADDAHRRIVAIVEEPTAES